MTCGFRAVQVVELAVVLRREDFVLLAVRNWKILIFVIKMFIVRQKNV